MKPASIRFSRRYVAGLRQHLQHGPGASLQLALSLGRQAVALRLEALELARIHEAAVSALESTNRKNGWLKRAENFFSEALTPIVETHRAARQSQAHVSGLEELLGQRTNQLAVTNRQLQRGVARREVRKVALAKSGKKQAQGLAESLQLQTRLRQLTHRVLAAQEDERYRISHELQDEIAQTLLGINVRLLSLKLGAKRHTRQLKNQIASAQRLVVNSAKSVRQFARKLNSQPPAFGDQPLSTR